MRRRMMMGTVDYSKQYLTTEVLESGTLSFRIHADITTDYVTSVSYSIDNGNTWVTTQNSSSQITITTPTIPAGGKVLWKGIATRYSFDNNCYSRFIGNVDFNVRGNVMSMLYGDNFIGQTTLTEEFALSNLFRQCTNVISARNMILPATTLTPSCYRAMFYLATNLTTAPVLPALTLAYRCYHWMFASCTSLNYVKAMFTTTPSDNYTSAWLRGVAANGTFVKNSAATWSVAGENGIPEGWTVETA